jgi:broad specificity phosphatase PhoE
MAPTVTFLRHAESIGNVMARKFGQTGLDMKQLADCGLTAEGFAQCAGLRERLAATDFDVIYCSPALRCRETLLYGVIGAKEAPVIVDWRLAEGRGWAEFNELTPAAEVDWPAAWDITAAADQREEKETVADVNMRTTRWWLDASDRGDSNARILVVTHANPIQIWAAAWPEVDDLHLGNAEIHIFEDAAY